MFKTVRTLITAMSVATLLAGLAIAGQPPRREGAMHAMRDLHFARAILDRHEGWGRAGEDQARAVGEIDRAMEELSHALGDADRDHRDDRDHGDASPIDEHMEPRERIHRAMEALGRAKESIGRDEGGPREQEMRDRIFRHIDNAQQALDHAMRGWRDH